MKNYKSKYGIITDGKLILYPVNCQNISLSDIHALKIIEKKSELDSLFNYFKRNNYDFTIMLDNEKEVKFSFSKKSLNRAIAFKIRIWHTKFSLQNTILEKSYDNLKYKLPFCSPNYTKPLIP